MKSSVLILISKLIFNQKFKTLNIEIIDLENVASIWVLGSKLQGAFFVHTNNFLYIFCILYFINTKKKFLCIYDVCWVSPMVIKYTIDRALLGRALCIYCLVWLSHLFYPAKWIWLPFYNVVNQSPVWNFSSQCSNEVREPWFDVWLQSLSSAPLSGPSWTDSCPGACPLCGTSSFLNFLLQFVSYGYCFCCHVAAELPFQSLCVWTLESIKESFTLWWATRIYLCPNPCPIWKHLENFQETKGINTRVINKEKARSWCRHPRKGTSRLGGCPSTRKCLWCVRGESLDGFAGEA